MHSNASYPQLGAFITGACQGVHITAALSLPTTALTEPQRIGTVSGVVLGIAAIAAILLVVLSVVECTSGRSGTHSNA